MIRLIAVVFALAVATSAQAMTLAPLSQPDNMSVNLVEIRPTKLAKEIGHMEMPQRAPPMFESSTRNRWRLLFFARAVRNRKAAHDPL